MRNKLTHGLKKSACYRSSLRSAIGLALATTPVALQAEEARVLEEIVVTAQKRTESLQDAPISIIAYTSETLDDFGINSLTDTFNGAMPSLRVAPFIGRASAMSVGMRGMVPVDATQITRDTTVGIYIDGVYLGRVQGLGMELADVERIEVLRGPQGTLFGRNTVGGAVSVVTRRPTGEWGADIKAGMGNLDGRTLAAHVNLPAFAGFSFKVDAVLDRRDGWVKNPLETLPANYSINGKTGDASDFDYDWGKVERHGYRLSMEWQPVDSFSLLYTYDRSKEDPTGGYHHLGGTTQRLPGFARLETDRASRGRIGVPNLEAPQMVEGHGLLAEWDISESLLLRSITSYRRLDSTQWDQDSGSFSTFRAGSSSGRFSFANVDQNQFSQEIQFVGNTDSLQYVAGAYYFREEGEDTATVFTTATYNSTLTGITLRNPPTTSGRVPDRAAEALVKSKALFGQVTWTPAALQDLHVTVGARYTDDSKDGRLIALRGVDPLLSFDQGYKRIDPTVTVAWDLSETTNVYAKYARAYRAGGSNTRSATLRAFDEEVVVSYELGLKTELLEGRGRLNLAGYTMALQDAQVDFSNPANVSVTETINVSKKRKVNGIEADLTLLAWNNLLLNLNYVWTEAKSTPVTNPFSNLTIPLGVAQTPTHAASLALDYDFPRFEFGTLTFHADMQWNSGYTSTGGKDTDPTETNEVVLVNARLTLGEIALGATEASVSVWGKNLTDKTFELFDFLLPTTLNSNRFVMYNDPRTWGLEVRVTL